ncbi:glycosyltransferase family 2 protein [Stratiformator vulcanicus]|uniref:Teichuronic acid biosynthesis glycosyltransferase TuaG n=1 Tax=Stratiformator vulcanicus TaxID=2527980 RepID=A0A517QVT4_9PLAN|nr:glycosyltransferase family A protein [Stratiformator vulcanicus]QDT35765.1 Putative teichuronic acid biosynthesis glycosyltransferase TuaG [Stratiformator vulcanicus]
MSESAVRVSVIIPCFNAGPYLRPAIESVLTQTRPAHEVIVIDDGSTDGSGDVAASFGSPVKVYRQENSGESVARNRGMAEATGDWIALLDADDIWKPEKLEEQVIALQWAREKGVEPACVYTDHFRFQGHKIWPPSKREPPDGSANPSLSVLLYAANLPSASMFPRELGVRIGFPEFTRISEDMLFWSELIAFGTFVRVPRALAGYRVSSSQQTKNPHHDIASLEVRYQFAKSSSHLFSENDLQQLRSKLSRLANLHRLSAFASGHDDVVVRADDFIAGIGGRKYPLAVPGTRKSWKLVIGFAQSLIQQAPETYRRMRSLIVGS